MTLAEILTLGYRASVMHRGSISSAFDEFNAAASDAAFLDAAKAELERLRSVPQAQCFASGQHANFLEKAIANFNAVPHVTPLPPRPDLIANKEEDMTSKLKGLADLGKSLVGDVESRAAASMDRLNKARERANEGLDKLDGVSAEIEKSASDLENFANQITNGPPTE